MTTKKVGAIAFLVGLVVLLALTAAVGGWLLMLLMGVLHHEVSESVPAIGFWPAAGIALLARLVVQGLTKN